MNKKKFYIIFTCGLVAAVIIFQIVMYSFVGEDVLVRKGPMRVFWLLFPIVVLVLSFVRDIIIKRKYEDNDEQ